VVVVNSSAGEGVVERRWVRTPFVGEVASVLAAKDVMYRQTTAVRRRLLNVRYRIAQESLSLPSNRRLLDEALRGTIVQIDRSPFELPTAFSAFDGDGLGQRARAAIETLERDELPIDARTYWTAEARANRSVKTTLSRVDAARASSLVRHAYVLTMVNCHVLLGYPLLPIPAVGRFQQLVTKD
jgi:hypothetical protein